MPSGRHAGGRSSMGSSRSSFSRSSSRIGSSARMRSSMSSRSSVGYHSHMGPSHHHHWHGPRRFRRYGFWGPTVVLTDGQSSALGMFLVLIFMSLFFGFIVFMGGMSITSEMEQRASEHEYYMSFIENAKASGRQAYVDVTGIYRGENNKYWVEYGFGHYFSLSNSYMYDGWSYTMYTLAEAQSYMNEGQILVYHDFNPTGYSLDKNDPNNWNMNTDTIPADYEFQTLDQDGDYQNLKSTKGIMDIIFYICIGVAVFCVVAAVRVSSKAQKEEATATVSSVNSTSSSATSTASSSTHTYCAYCGSKLEKTATKCPNCGSKTN